jgi:hypothetical protein
MPGRDGGGAAPDLAASTCPPQTRLTLAVHIVMDATWPADKLMATRAGTGKIHLWNLSRLDAVGGQLSGDETRSCGTTLPGFELTAIGTIAAGGSRVLVEIPDSVWNAPTIPRFHSAGRITGWDPGSPFMIDGTLALIGLMMDDPNGAWPDSFTGVTALDADGDGKPGFIAVPRSGGGYVQPPTAIGIGGSAPPAEQLHLASRTVVSLDGKLTSCSEVAGSATVKFFDSHVVGCKVRGGGDCTAAQTKFVDDSRTLYTITAATFTARKIADTATCDEARAAVP